MRTRHPAVFASLAVLLAVACGKSPDGPTGPAMRLIASPDLSDTIQAAPLQGLVVQVLGQTGKPDSGVAVVFDACPGDDYGVSCGGGIQLASAVDSIFRLRLSAYTDAAGRALVRLRMGTRVGPASVKINLPVYGLADSITCTVLPGAAVGVMAFLRDTTVDLGGTYTPRAGLVDRAGNLRSDPVSYEATSPAVQVSATGSVSAVAVGRAYVRVRGTVGGRSLVDSTGVTVVPKARIAILGAHLQLQSVAGGAVRRLVDAPGGAGVVWSPAGDRIAYFTNSIAAGLGITDTLGQATALATPGVTGASSPEYSRDGLWIYFHGDAGHGTQVFRMHPDGTGLEAMQSPTGGDKGLYPSPSPDGTRFAYSDSANLLVKTIATGHVDTLSITGFTGVAHPRWSPDGSTIAFVGNSWGTVGLVRLDSPGVRNLGGYADEGLTWSPDSKWLLGSRSGGPVILVDVTTGVLYQLTTRGHFPAWHP